MQDRRADVAAAAIGFERSQDAIDRCGIDPDAPDQRTS